MPLDDALARDGIAAPVTAGLRDVLEGRTSPDDWLESVRSAGARGTRHAA